VARACAILPRPPLGVAASAAPAAGAVARGSDIRSNRVRGTYRKFNPTTELTAALSYTFLPSPPPPPPLKRALSFARAGPEPIQAESRVLSPVNPLSVSPLLPANPRTVDSGPGSALREVDEEGRRRRRRRRRTTCTVVVPFFFTYVQAGLSRIVFAM